MVPFGNNFQLLCLFSSIPVGLLQGPACPLRLAPLSQPEIGRGTRPLAQLFRAKQHGPLGWARQLEVQDFENGHGLRGRGPDAFGR
jgi:hypothetical protein